MFVLKQKARADWRGPLELPPWQPDQPGRFFSFQGLVALRPNLTASLPLTLDCVRLN
jgi:hypothetical protein